MIEQNKYFWMTPKGNVVMLGGNSDIAKELASRFYADDWQVFNWVRGGELPDVSWDVVVVCIGVLNPIGKFFGLDCDEWEGNIDSNVLLPLRLLRSIWKNRRPNASVCFFSGAGISKPAETYSGYSASKIMLYKMTELLDDEEKDAKFFILGPGMVRTKIQQQTLDAGDKAANHERVNKFMLDGDDLHGNGTAHSRIYDCLRWCMDQPKNVVGGRNIYVPLDMYGKKMATHLAANKNLFKLRRCGDGIL